MVSGNGTRVNESLFLSPVLLRWGGDDLPIWQGQGWNVIEENLFGPLLIECASFHVFPSDPGVNVNHPIAVKVREFIEENASINEKDDYIFSDPLILINNPIAPFFWAPVRFGYGMSRLMTFNAESFERVLRALSYTQITGCGPIHRGGNWKERDKLAEILVRNGGFAVVNDCATFQLHYSDAKISEVNGVIDLMERRWERCKARPGDPWEPDDLFENRA